jgi:hypothetical protein
VHGAFEQEVGELSSIESSRASAEARRNIAGKRSTTAAHEADLLRYLGAVYYEAQHGRANSEEVERAIAHVDEHVRAHGPISVPEKQSSTRGTAFPPQPG